MEIMAKIKDISGVDAAIQSALKQTQQQIVKEEMKSGSSEKKCKEKSCKIKNDDCKKTKMKVTRNDLEEIKDHEHALMLTEDQERVSSRRAGMSERNQTERVVVYQTVRNIVLNKNVNDMEI